MTFGALKIQCSASASPMLFKQTSATLTRCPPAPMPLEGVDNPNMCRYLLSDACKIGNGVADPCSVEHFALELSIDKSAPL